VPSAPAIATAAQVIERLRPIIDPELGSSIVDLGMVKDVQVAADRAIQVDLALTVAGCPARQRFESAVGEALADLEGAGQVTVRFGVMTDAERKALGIRLGQPELPTGALSRVESIIAVASGKGGVGKSTLTANLAVALANCGARVGVIDADVYGYSIPRLLGLRGRPQMSDERKLVPLVGPAGVRVMSIGFFLAEDAVVPWRGAMLHKVLQQFLQDVDWGELDHLLIDLPPGTGDVAMSLAQLLPRARFVIVTTPEPLAQRVASRAAKMAVQLKRDVVGVIENMSCYIDPTGRRHELSGAGGGARLAEDHDVPLLGSVPLTTAVREHSDAGRPLVLERSEDPAAKAIEAVASRLAELPPPKAVAAPPVAGSPPAAVGVALPMA